MVSRSERGRGPRSRPRQLQQSKRLAAALLALLPLLALTTRCAVSERVPFVFQGGEAPWIAAPLPVTAELQQWGRADAPLTRFERWLGPEHSAAPARLRLRALGRFALYLNDERLAEGDGRRWRDTREIPLEALRPGGNRLRVDVANRRGPALLSLRLEAPGAELVADESWSVSRDARDLGRAVRADDTRVNPGSFAVETPGEALAATWQALLLLFAGGALASRLAERRVPARLRARLPALMLLAVALAWLWLFFTKLARLPLSVGFDALHHLLYVERILAGSLPLASDGWSTFHPPLLYAATAGLVLLAGGADAAPDLVFKLLPFAAGLGNVWLAFALARRLFPGSAREPCLAALLVAALPVNLYSAAYFSNESLHAFLAGLAVLATVDLLLAPRASARRVVALGLLFGLAALAKFTALIAAAVALFCLVAKLRVVERAPLARAVRLTGLAALAACALAGWYYARNWWTLGSPVYGNWDFAEAGRVWWQQPGFHTWRYYVGFGEALRHPYLAGFHSFWDGLYATFWGDGGIAGRALPSQRIETWSYDFMSAGYWVALPATGVLVYGTLRCLRDAFRDADPRRRAAFSFLLALVWAVGFAVLWLTAPLPFFAQARASYGLLLAAPLGVFFAAGAGSLTDALAARFGAPARVALGGWLALHAGTLFLGFAA